MDKDWRCRKYGPLGWMEALIKLLGIGVGVASLSIYHNDDYDYKGTRLGQIIIMCILGAVLVALVVQRVLDKELFALGFIIVHIFGHWIMTIVVILSDDPSAFLFTYVFLIILGEYVRIMYVVLEESQNLDLRFFTKPILLGISALFIVGFLIIIILQIVIWLVEYDTT